MAALRKLFIILALFGFKYSVGQQIQNLGGRNTRVVALNQFQVDSLFVLPGRVDTSFTPYKAGAMVYRLADSRFYYHDGSSWKPIFYGATVTETDPTVSAVIKSVSASDTTRWAKIYVDSIRRSNDTVYYFTGGTRFFAFKDSVGQAALKIDSVKRKVGSDSVFYYRSGTQVFAYRDSIGSGEANTASNLGAGGLVFQSKVGSDLRFRSLLSANTNLVIAQNTNDLTFTAKSFVDSVRKKSGTDSVFFYTNGVGSFAFRDSSIAGGEANTASNVGSGVGVFKSKVSSDLQFKSITSDTTIAVTGNTNDVEIKVDQSRISSVKRLNDTAAAIRAAIGASDTVFAANGVTVNGDTLKLGGNLNQHTSFNGQSLYNLNFENIKNFYGNGAILDWSFDSVINIHAADSLNLYPTQATYNHGKLILLGTSGFLSPNRMTTAQRTALTGLVAGAFVWDTDLGEFYRWNGSSWAALGGGSTYTAGSGLTLTGTTFKIGGTYTENATSALTTSYYHDFTSGATTVMRINGVDGNVSIGNTPFSSSALFTLNSTTKSNLAVWTNGATVQYIFERLGKTTFQNYTSSNGGAKDPQLTLSMTRNPTSGSTAGASLYIQPNIVGSGSYTGNDYGIEIIAGGALNKFQGLRTNGYIEMTSAHALNLGANTMTQRDALVLHRAGSVVWNSSLSKIQYYDGSAWKSVQDSVFVPTHAEGTYTPTKTDVTNIGTATFTTLHYQRVGNYIEVFGEVTIDPTATGDTHLRITLPIASAFTNSYDLAGTGTNFDNSQTIRIYGAFATGEASLRFNASVATSHVYQIHFRYYYQAP